MKRIDAGLVRELRWTPWDPVPLPTAILPHAPAAPARDVPVVRQCEQEAGSLYVKRGDTEKYGGFRVYSAGRVSSSLDSDSSAR